MNFYSVGGILITILIAGIMGGVINSLLSNRSIGRIEDKNRVDGKRNNLNWKEWLLNILLGIAAALLVPLFLETISSNLVENILDGPVGSANSDFLVFFGFCLLAALSSRAFIQRLSDRLIQDLQKQVEEVKQEAKDVKTDVEDVQEGVEVLITKAGEEIEDPENQTETLKDRVDLLNLNEWKVLRALISNPKFTLRSLSGISKETTLEKSQVKEILGQLVKVGLVREINREKGARWSISTEGQWLIENSNSHVG